MSIVTLVQEVLLVESPSEKFLKKKTKKYSATTWLVGCNNFVLGFIYTLKLTVPGLVYIPNMVLLVIPKNGDNSNPQWKVKILYKWLCGIFSLLLPNGGKKFASSFWLGIFKWRNHAIWSIVYWDDVAYRSVQLCLVFRAHSGTFFMTDHGFIDISY